MGKRDVLRVMFAVAAWIVAIFVLPWDLAHLLAVLARLDECGARLALWSLGTIVLVSPVVYGAIRARWQEKKNAAALRNLRVDQAYELINQYVKDGLGEKKLFVWHSLLVDFEKAHPEAKHPDGSYDGEQLNAWIRALASRLLVARKRLKPALIVSDESPVEESKA